LAKAVDEAGAQTTISLAIFTIMANAPEALVASLCLCYAAPVLLTALVLPGAFSTSR
jgi:hypothetical protein